MIDEIELLIQLRLDARREAIQPITMASQPTGRDADFVTDGQADVSRLCSALATRRAVNHFSASSLDPDALCRMRTEADGIDHSLWPDEHADQPLRYLVAASRVSGLRPGLYELDRGGLTELVPFQSEQEVKEMVLQPEFAEAPAIVVVVGSLFHALESRGSHGHRLLLERAGAACEAAWLSAIADGYVGSIFAGFLPSALKSALGLDGFKSMQLLAFAVGHPVARTLATL